MMTRSSSIDSIADHLQGAGVRALFGVPGSGPSLQLITALEDRGVPFHGACHESAAAIMAGAFGRISESLGCCVSIKGPGLANMLAGIVSNGYEQLPVLSLSEAYPAGVGARAHKRFDHTGALAGCVKGYAGLDDERVPDLIAIAHEEVPGPVHLDLAPQSGILLRTRVWSRSTASLEEALARVRASSRPVAVAGSLATRRRWGGALRSLGIPIFTTVAAKGVLDERSPYAAGVFTGDGRSESPEARIMAEADLVIGFGLRNLELLTPHTFGVPNVLLDVCGDGWGMPSDTVVTEPGDRHFDAVMEVLCGVEWGGELVATTREAVLRHLTADDWLPGAVLHQIRGMASDNTRLVVDTGLFCTVAEHIWWTPEPSRFLATANGRFMGASIPMSIGAALADPSSPVICAVGDGGIRVAVGELKLALTTRIPLLLLLLTDGRYGSVAGAPAACGGSQSATKIPRPSWAAALAALGFHVHETRSLSELVRAVGSWRPAEGPTFIEATFDPARYASMTAQLR